MQDAGIVVGLYATEGGCARCLNEGEGQIWRARAVRGHHRDLPGGGDRRRPGLVALVTFADELDALPAAGQAKIMGVDTATGALSAVPLLTDGGTLSLSNGQRTN
nr:hypothetical protein GCM10010200_081770 [Actinomadura rugatobispora]